MARNYALDTNAAREANSGGKRIIETGKYTGQIIAAFWEKNEKGTESVNFMFESDQGQEAGPLALYTHNNFGEQLHGYKVVSAIMTCVKLRDLTSKPGTVEIYDFNAGGVVSKQKEIYPELTGKRIGLVLLKEEYTNANGDQKSRMLLAAPFDANTELMAGEILDRSTQPQALAKYMEYIMANPVRKQRARGSNAQKSAYEAQAPADFDDCPF